MKKYLIQITGLFFLFQSCSNTNYLKNSQSNFLKTNSEKIVKYTFEEEYKTLGHNSKPWETTDYTAKGELWINNTTFQKHDTLTNSRGRKYSSKLDLNNDIL